MYASIYRYAKDHGLSPLRNRTFRKPAAYICIDRDGDYERLDIVPKDNRTERKCPDIGKNRYASGKNTNIICEKKEYIFCGQDDTGEITGNEKKHTGWMEITGEGSGHSDTMNSIWKFCTGIENDPSLFISINRELENSGIKPKDFISFRVDGKRAEENTDWEEWFDQKMDTLDNTKKGDAKEGISAVTGKAIIPIQGKEAFPQIMSSQTTTGAPIYSCTHKTVSGASCAFTSYGVVNSLGCPMSVDEAESIKAGLEYLLKSDRNHNDWFNIIYWFDCNEAEDLISLSIRGSFEDDEDDDGPDIAKNKESAYSRLLDAVRSGSIPENILDQGHYHIVHYKVPAKGRFYLGRERTGSYGDLYKNLCFWYRDGAITTAYWDPDQKRYVERQWYPAKLYGVLFGLLEHKNAKNKWDEIDNEFGTDKEKLLESIHENKQISRVFYEKALKQVIRVNRTDSASDEGKSARKDACWPVPLQIIKVYLVRSGKEDYKMDALNLENTGTAYNCGRLLASVNRLQQVSSGFKVKLTIGQKYFKAASKTPGKIMTMALSNAENYIKKLDNEGTKIYFIRLIGEISGKVGTTMPEKFSKTEQGEFMLGYFYQSKEFLKKENTEKITDADDPNSKED